MLTKAATWNKLSIFHYLLCGTEMIFDLLDLQSLSVELPEYFAASVFMNSLSPFVKRID